jgi:hypothetical protein
MTVAPVACFQAELVAAVIFDGLPTVSGTTGSSALVSAASHGYAQTMRALVGCGVEAGRHAATLALNAAAQLRDPVAALACLTVLIEAGFGLSGAVGGNSTHRVKHRGTQMPCN